MAQSVGSKFTDRSKGTHRKRAGYKTKNHFRKVAEHRCLYSGFSLRFRSSSTSAEDVVFKQPHMILAAGSCA